MIVHSPTGHRVEGMLSGSPQRHSNIRYFHWEDEAAVDRCIEEYHGLWIIDRFGRLRSKMLVTKLAAILQELWGIACS